MQPEKLPQSPQKGPQTCKLLNSSHFSLSKESDNPVLQGEEYEYL